MTNRPAWRTPARSTVLALVTAAALVAVQAQARADSPDPAPANLQSSPGPAPAASPSSSAGPSFSASPSTSASPTMAASSTTSAGPAPSPGPVDPVVGPAVGAARAFAPSLGGPGRNAGQAGLRARPAITLVLAATWSAGVPQPLSGTVVALAPGPVPIELQSWAGTGWVTQVTTNAIDGRFATTWAPTAPGPMTWRAVAAQPETDDVVSESVVVSVTAQVMITVSAVTAADVAYSYRPGCPVPPSSLRKISLNYWDFDGLIRRGTIIGALSAVRAYETVFTAVFAARFPIRQVRPVDYYYYGVKGHSAQSDIASMAADNTSAFNCRKVTGDPYRMSRHSWGDAIDFNTVENPYLTGGRIYPTAGRAFLDRRTYREGMVLPGSVIATTMARLHWYWGARWSNPDYQHFSSTGQ